MISIPLSTFTSDDSFPFYIHYGGHDEPLFMHTHDGFLELVIVMNGSAVHIVDNEHFTIRKGDAFVIGQDTCHGYDAPVDFRICNIMFRKNFLDLSAMDIAASEGFQALFVLEPAASRNTGFCSNLHLSADEYAEVSRIIKRLVDEYFSDRPGRKTMIKGDFLRLTVTLSRLYDIDRVNIGEGVIKLARPLAYIEQNLAEDISVAKLAELANYSQRQLIRLFREAFDCVPSVYITRLRMNTAKELLSETDMPVAAVGEKCGYTDSNYFSRIFRKSTGMTPTEFRRHR